MASWMGCGLLDSGGLPGGTWSGTQHDNETLEAGSGDDATSGAAPTVGADAGMATSATRDGGEAGDAAGRSDDAATVSADAEAGFDLDTGSPLTTFTLLDTRVTTAVDGQAVPGWDPIPEGSTIDLSKVGGALSIRANTTPATVGSVLFVLDGVTMHTEDAVPYTECSDDGAGTIDPCTYPEGKHTLVVTPYTAADLGGTAMPSTTLYFSVVSTAGDAGTTDAAAD
jgi:hypothetical protein